MRIPLLLIFVGLLAGCTATPKPRATISQPAVVQTQAAAGDPIDQLVARLSASPLWPNGLFSAIDLPPTASAEQIVKIALEKDEPNIGQVTNYKILVMRQIHFDGWNLIHTAALVQTNVGEKIVLFSYHGPNVGWWNRVYDAKPSA